MQRRSWLGSKRLRTLSPSRSSAVQNSTAVAVKELPRALSLSPIKLRSSSLLNPSLSSLHTWNSVSPSPDGDGDGVLTIDGGFCSGGEGHSSSKVLLQHLSLSIPSLSLVTLSLFLFPAMAEMGAGGAIFFFLSSSLCSSVCEFSLLGFCVLLC
ncbi:hypothetical protein PIB30_051841 [Stylosanthes scabra]|uniref:Uncharacterized protein n=1 Tax=Stylosanthes scabra TaxID=79078 RepID=A0ABU6YGT5_9FABA|nr:hypothetical protein [Stylosanthes scabra]